MEHTPQISPEMQEAILGLRFTDVDGHAAIGIGLTALFLFRDGSSIERRRAVSSVVQEYLAIVGTHIRWRDTADESTDLHLVSPTPIEASKAFPTLKMPWWCTFGGGATRTDASAYELTFVCKPSWHPIGISTLHLHLPLAYMNSDFMIMFQRFASMLHADQAYGGVGIFQRPGTAYASAAGHLAYMLASTYPGLQIFSPSDAWESLTLRDSLSAVNWLTAVSDRYLERIGGWEEAVREFDPRIAIYKYDGGVIFQAGAKPDLGDSSKGLRPELYCQLARALKPLRFTGKQGGFYRPSDKGPTLDAANTAMWLNRFD